MDLPESRYPDLAKRTAFLRSTLERVAALPGVMSAGISNKLPLSGEGGNNLIGIEGTSLPLMERPLADIRQVNPDYFRTMGIPVRAGRIFAETDRERNVALVSTVTAARLWPAQNAIGKRLRFGAEDSPLIEVVGIAGDVRGVGLNRSPSLTIYIPYWKRSYGEESLVVRTAMNPLAAAPGIRTAIRRIDPELPVPEFRTMDDIVSDSVAQRRFQMSLVLLFAAAAMLLASLGIYGVVSYSVAQRTHEMGIRLALGAQPANIRRMVLGQSLLPVLLGLLAGVTASVALGRIMSTLLFGVSVWDPATLSGVAALLIAVAAAATYVPVHRATHVDPVSALRYE